MRRFLIALAVITAALVGAQLWFQHYAETRLKSVIADMGPEVDITVGKARFWLWGTADLSDVQITPDDLLTASYGLPLGYSIRIDHVRIHNLRPSFNGPAWLKSADVAISGLQIPVPDWHWTVTVARAPNGSRLYAPTAADLNIFQLDTNVAAHLDFSQGWREPALTARSVLPQLAAIDLACAFRLSDPIPPSEARLMIKHCSVDYRDQGLARRFETDMAHRNGVELTWLRQRITRQVSLDAERTRWPLLNTQAIQSFVNDPRRLRLTINPPHPLTVDQIPRGVWRGLPAYFGLRAEIPPPANAG